MPAGFPSLSLNPFYPQREEQEDVLIKSPAEAGYVQTRQRFTKARKTWTLQFRFLPTSDKTTLEDFYDTTAGKGSESFNWIDTADDSTNLVRFDAVPRYSLIQRNKWNVEIILVEV